MTDNFLFFRGFMGWRSKFIFLLVVYFAGFATAIYYLAPNGRMATSSHSYSAGSQDQSDGSGWYDKACAKASASFSGMDTKEFKEKFNLGMQKLREMSKNSKNANNSQ